MAHRKTPMETALHNLDEALAAVAALVPAEGEVNHKLSNMRSFAGNDSRVINRIPLVRQKLAAERALLPSMTELRAAIGRVTEANNALL